jgi:hypothetical protein
MPSIQYLRLDATNDPIFVPQAALVDGYAVAQAILTSLRLFLAEWFENIKLGVPMFQSILNAPGTARSQQVMASLLNQVVLSVPYVSSVQDAVVIYDPAIRSFKYSAVANTAFGPVPVTISPGSSASIAGS